MTLQENLIRFNKFLQENEAKRTRAEKRAADEVRARKGKQKEIEELEDRLKTMRTRSAEVELLVHKSACLCRRDVEGGCAVSVLHLLTVWRACRLQTSST